MKQIDDELHPLLADMIDRDKWRAKIDQMEKHGFDPEANFQIRRHMLAVKWLNVWLNGLSVA
ncbi:hypothetical protein C8024_14325 [Sphingopyxis sp. BSNA05]|nr:hypothetical protein [Sphingopyxis sp. BSNA05]